MYPTLTPVGKPNMRYRETKTKRDLFKELAEREAEIKEIKEREAEVKASLREDPKQEEEEEEEEEAEGEGEVEDEEEEEAEVPSDHYLPNLLSDSVEMEETSMSYIYGSMPDDEDDSS